MLKSDYLCKADRQLKTSNRLCPVFRFTIVNSVSFVKTNPNPYRKIVDSPQRSHCFKHGL